VSRPAPRAAQVKRQLGGTKMVSMTPRPSPFAVGLAAAVLLAAAAGISMRAQQPAARATTTPAAKLDPKAEARLTALKNEAAASVEDMRTFTQQMVDSVFSFGELGFQEFETSKYLTNILRQNGFAVEEGISGIPTAWMATWGSGKPVIALGSDIDGIPTGSQKPGVAYHDPFIEGGPGHGEGHNSGQPLNITAAIALKKIMEREKIPGTLKLWPGVAEELVGTKAYFVRDGYFKDVDVVLFTHVGNNFTVNWGDGSGNGLVSVEYTFKGESAHSAGAPWRGRSASDAAMLMEVGWSFRREHLRIQQRSHSVVTFGGDQPNVVPPSANIWYYFRETDYPNIKRMWEIGDNMAKAAALMTDTTMSSRVLGSAWPQHMNKVIAETTYANILKVGLPQWSEADQTLAKAIQKELGVEQRGLATEIPKLNGRSEIPDDEKRGGGSDDIGDVSWNVPTVTLRYPANIEGGPGHNWANAITMATPIAHKGVTAGAKVQAMTVLDLLLTPSLVQQAWEYFRDVQTKDRQYTPLVRPEDKPAIHLNQATMAKYREEMKKYYYDPSKYPTYLDQLGIKYPTVR
jgi:aminobenzoyl-glutamate utilization protein B